MRRTVVNALEESGSAPAAASRVGLAVVVAAAAVDVQAVDSCQLLVPASLVLFSALQNGNAVDRSLDLEADLIALQVDLKQHRHTLHLDRASLKASTDVCNSLSHGGSSIIHILIPFHSS